MMNDAFLSSTLLYAGWCMVIDVWIIVIIYVNKVFIVYFCLWNNNLADLQQILLSERTSSTHLGPSSTVHWGTYKRT
jgi:hypothetical protein